MNRSNYSWSHWQCYSIQSPLRCHTHSSSVQWCRHPVGVHTVGTKSCSSVKFKDLDTVARTVFDLPRRRPCVYSTRNDVCQIVIRNVYFFLILDYFMRFWTSQECWVRVPNTNATTFTANHCPCNDQVWSMAHMGSAHVTSNRYHSSKPCQQAIYISIDFDICVSFMQYIGYNGKFCTVQNCMNFFFVYFYIGWLDLSQ